MLKIKVTLRFSIKFHQYGTVVGNHRQVAMRNIFQEKQYIQNSEFPIIKCIKIQKINTNTYLNMNLCETFNL